jgi:PTS system nitrogen regulatory IIA component
MEINDVIASERVLRNVEARSKKHSLDIVCELLASADPALTQGAIFDSMIRREKLGCTALEGGVALPHGCVQGIDKVYAAFVRLRHPVDYDAPDGVPVDLVLGLALPEGEGGCDTDDLADLAELLRSGDLRRMLREAKSGRAMFDLLTHYRPTRSASA